MNIHHPQAQGCRRTQGHRVEHKTAEGLSASTCLTGGHWREGTAQIGTSQVAYVMTVLVIQAHEGGPADSSTESVWNGGSKGGQSEGSQLGKRSQGTMSEEISLYSHALPQGPRQLTLTVGLFFRAERVLEARRSVKALELRAGAKRDKSKELRNKDVGLREILEPEAKAQDGRARERRMGSLEQCDEGDGHLRKQLRQTDVRCADWLRHCRPGSHVVRTQLLHTFTSRSRWERGATTQHQPSRPWGFWQHNCRTPPR